MSAGVQLHWGVQIPVRDGIRLGVTVYLPKACREPLPTVVTLTPYIEQRYHEEGVYFAERGFAFLAVDTRGRGNSEGIFRPFIQEAADAHDVVEWASRQSY